jgi:hypothetical protein
MRAIVFQDIGVAKVGEVAPLLLRQFRRVAARDLGVGERRAEHVEPTHRLIFQLRNRRACHYGHKCQKA